MTLPSSYRRANSLDDGPFRNVDRVDVIRFGDAHYARVEILVCGHRGRVLQAAYRLDDLGDPVFSGFAATPGKKRRCYSCRDLDAIRAANEADAADALAWEAARIAADADPQPGAVFMGVNETGAVEVHHDGVMWVLLQWDGLRRAGQTAGRITCLFPQIGQTPTAAAAACTSGAWRHPS